MPKKQSKTERPAAVALHSLVSRRSSKCNCDLCKRGRRYYKNTAKLPKSERDWMRGFYDAVLDAECEEEMQKATNESR